MEKLLDGKRIAVLATDGFEQIELLKPLKALKKAGAEVDIISIKRGMIKGWDRKDWGKTVEATASTDTADPTDYDALMLPGGVMNPDRLRLDPKAVAFVKSFVTENKPIAAICHAPWTLIEAGAVKNRKVTSWPSLRSDLENAGATWVDQEVVVDQGLITSRKPDDIPAFTERMIEEFSSSRQKVEMARATAEGMPERPRQMP